MIKCVYPKWLDEKSGKQYIEPVQVACGKHTVKVRFNHKHYLILEWKNKAPGHSFAFGIMLDKKAGVLVIYSDFSQVGIARWSAPVTLENIVKDLSDKERFIKVLENGLTPIWTFSYAQAMADLIKAERDAEAFFADDKDGLKEVQSDYSAMRELMDKYGRDVAYNGAFVGLWLKYNPVDSSYRFGKRLSNMVYVWAYVLLSALQETGLIKLTKKGKE